MHPYSFFTRISTVVGLCLHLRDGPLLGRPRGLAILYRKSISDHISIHTNMSSDRAFVFSVRYNDDVVKLFRERLCYPINEMKFRRLYWLFRHLACCPLCDEIDSCNFCIIGDMDIITDSYAFSYELSHFCAENSLILSDRQFLPVDTFAYHIICSNMLHN